MEARTRAQSTLSLVEQDVINALDRVQDKMSAELEACLTYMSNGLSWIQIAEEMSCSLEDIDRNFHSICIRAMIDHLPRDEREELIRKAQLERASGLHCETRSSRMRAPCPDRTQGATVTGSVQSPQRLERTVSNPASVEELELMAHRAASLIGHLSPRQLEIFRHMLRGLQGKELADAGRYSSEKSANAVASSIRGALGITKRRLTKEQTLAVLCRAKALYDAKPAE